MELHWMFPLTFFWIRHSTGFYNLPPKFETELWRRISNPHLVDWLPTLALHVDINPCKEAIHRQITCREFSCLSTPWIRAQQHFRASQGLRYMVNIGEKGYWKIDRFNIIIYRHTELLFYITALAPKVKNILKIVKQIKPNNWGRKKQKTKKT